MATFPRTQLNLARLARRTSSVEKLADAYKKQVASMTEDYTKQFSGYQQKVKETMAPFEEAFNTYTTVSKPQYEADLAAYKTKLDAYNAALSAYKENPYGQVRASYNNRLTQKVGGQFYQGDYEINGMRLNDYLASIGSPTRYTIGQYRNEGLSGLNPDVQYLKPAPEKFSDQAPSAPEVPTAPQIEEFDSSEFETKKGALEQTFKREVGERRAARLQATRRTARTMLGGIKE